MSLVNDMLDDLEQRRSREPASPLKLDWLAAQPSQKRRRSKVPLAVIVIVAALVLMGVVAWFYLSTMEQRGVQPPVDERQVSAPAIVAKPVTLQAIEWISDEEAMRLRISLSEIKPYSIRRDNNKLILQFYGVENSLSVEDLLPRAPVQSVGVQQQKGDVVATLAIAGEFDFSDRLLKESGHQVEVTIRPVVQQPVGGSKSESNATNKTAVTGSVTDQNTVAKAEVNTVASQPLPAKPKPVVAARSVEPLRLTPSQQDLRAADRARRLLQQGDSYQAQQVLEDILANQPAALRSAKLLASLWLSQQRLERAGELIEFQLTQQPGDIELRLLKGRLLMARGEAEAAVEWLMSASPDIAAHQAYYELLGFAARQSRQYPLSEQVYRGLVAQDNGRGDWLVGLAIALDAQAKISEARNVYRQALADNRLSVPLKQYAQRRLSAAN